MDGSNAPACWHDVCGLDDIWPDTGVCARIAGRQVAVFRLRDDRLFALDNYDPAADANVLSRGLVGNLGERLVVASPVYKHHYDLVTGACLDDPALAVRAYRVRLVDGRVQVAV
ncbi:assimilatory nitrite reductase (NAD(P)H) small subunit [Fontimonas thermophila]|uniref:Assimilatory nitrite reductase (NAD(P)H) small subunit n=1 Tax=Fontimonas thermophila TaxID=1076937 RepID=A0A1I2H4E4_9GAMM|nr:nitrite reductase small subunit NirD [Fontimonas thermophila]SFF24240.1 assimilatory nitrite reductase (NAD(P)H) small subunit [Fontimonas thermophila]